MKKLFSIFSLAGLLLLSSCNDWLNVTPEGQVEAEDLYQTTQGCNSAIGGVYHTLSKSTLFGQNLSYGAIDILAQYWDFSSKTSHSYYKMANLDYKDQTTTATFDAIWKELYYAITQCNAFIHYSQKYQGQIDNYNLLLGEAYGLRALAHLELFEIFGPVIHTAADLQKDAIAYRTEYNNVARPFDKGEVVLQKAVDDLTMALGLFENDPIRDPEVGRTGDMNNSVLNYQDALNFRGARMNYFCALGLLARAEMLRKNPDAAYTYATRIIEESKDILSLIDKNNIMGNEARRINNYSTEMLGSFYVNNLYEMTDRMFGMNETSVESNKALLIDANQRDIWLNNIYNRTPDGTGSDNRYIYWFTNQNNDGTASNYYDFMKLHAAGEVVNMDPAYYPEIPIMRMSEVYYIACEAQIGKDNGLALKYLNDVRVTRNLPTIDQVPDNATLLEYLVREARKDFIGEGRMFFMYKRLFYDIYVRQGVTIAAEDSRFVVPIPDSEYEFSGIDKPNQKQL